MSPLVVLLSLVSAACASLLVPAQPAHLPALVLDPHGRPLDTAEVINARALHLQAKLLEGGHYAPLAHVAPVSVHSSPVLAHPLLAHAGLGHWLHKRSLGHLAYATPVVAHVAPSAVSHQSRVVVISSPAVVSHAVVAPVVAHAIAPVVAHALPAAVSHQSRVDVRSSPAIVSHALAAAPLVSAHAAWPAVASHSAWPAYGHGLSHGLGLGHILKKRSLGHLAYAAPVITHVAPSAVSHQSRVDVISSHAAPVAVAHAAPIAVAHAAPVVVAHAAPAVSHQSRVDVISSHAHVAPLAHSAVWSAPAAHWSHSPLAFASHW